MPKLIWPGSPRRPPPANGDPNLTGYHPNAEKAIDVICRAYGMRRSSGDSWKCSRTVGVMRLVNLVKEYTAFYEPNPALNWEGLETVMPRLFDACGWRKIKGPPRLLAQENFWRREYCQKITN